MDNEGSLPFFVPRLFLRSSIEEPLLVGFGKSPWLPCKRDPSET